MTIKRYSKVLIADDRSEVRDALRLVLSRKSTLRVVGEAADLSATLQAIDDLAPDILLLDWELPTLGERMTMAELRERYPELIVVAMSSDSSAPQEALLAGVDAFVSKTEPPDLWLDKLAHLRPKQYKGQQGR